MKVSPLALFAASLLALLPACSGSTLDVDESPGTGGSTSSSGGGSSTGQSSIVFSGYSEPKLDFDSDAVLLTLSSLDEGATGTIVFGDGPVPPIDPTKSYPGPSSYGSGVQAGTMPGFVYTVTNLRRTGDRLQIEYAFTEAYDDWCKQQISLPQPADMSAAYSCAPYRDGGLDCSGGDYSACLTTWPGSPDVPVSWDQWAMCTAQICTCNAEGCAADLTPHASVELRLEADGEQLNGTASSPTSTDLEVYLTRE